MANNLLWIGLCLFSFLGLWTMKRFFGIIGIYVWMALSIIVSNIMVLMTITLFGFVATLGNITYGSSFASTDVLMELRGKRAAHRAVWIGFCVQVCFTVFMTAMLFFRPAESDSAYPHMNALFRLLPRITIASLIAYLIAQSYDVWIFAKIRRRWSQRNMLWVRNNLSTLTSQCIDTVVFCSIAFIGVFDLSVVRQIFWTTYLIKVHSLQLSIPHLCTS